MSKNVLSKMATGISSRLSPLTIVLLASGVLLGGSVAVRYFTQETLDPRVKYSGVGGGEVASGQVRRRSVAASFGDEDPAVRYADRLRDGSALSIAFSLYTLNEALVNRRLLLSVGAVLEGLGKSKLMPPGLTVVNGSGVVRGATGLYYIRYRAKPFGVEVLSVGGNGLADGEVFVIRVPEMTKAPNEALAPSQVAGNYAAVFVAPRTDALLPKPFTPASVYLSAGWTQEALRAGPYSEEQFEELRSWLAQYQARGGE